MEPIFQAHKSERARSTGQFGAAVSGCRRAKDEIIPISGVSVVVAFAVFCVPGVSFGYLPASRAANLQPTDALRHE